MFKLFINKIVVAFTIYNLLLFTTLFFLLSISLLPKNAFSFENNLPYAKFEMKSCVSDLYAGNEANVIVDIENKKIKFELNENYYGVIPKGTLDIITIKNNQIISADFPLIKLFPRDQNAEILKRIITTVKVNSFKKTISLEGTIPYFQDKKTRKLIKKHVGIESGKVPTENFSCYNLTVLKKNNTQPKQKNNLTSNQVIPVSSGSGFFISSSGRIVTNFHVIDQCEKVFVNFKGSAFQSKTLAIDRMNDLAILETKIRSDLFYSISNEDVSLLEEIIAAGFPLGKKVSAAIKATQGSVTALAGYGDNYSEFQTDASLNSGNSGGPIIDNKGNIIGVAVSVYGKQKGIESFNFGIKSSVLRTFLKSNNISIKDPNTKALTKKELGNIITNATVYIECWMSEAKLAEIIKQQNLKKALFSELN